MKPRHPREGLGVETQSRLTYVHPAQAKYYELKTTVGQPIAKVDDLWIEETLPGHPDWIVASRIIGDDRGVPVVAELRIFPNIPDDAPRFCGEWSAQVQGCAARPIPRAGVTATMLRKAVAAAVTHHAKVTWVLRTWRPKIPGADSLAAALKESDAVVDAAGIRRYASPFDVFKGKRPRVRSTTRGRGRPEKWTEADYARVAITYNQAVQPGSARSPIQAVMDVHGMKRSQARNMIARARAKGLLDRAVAGMAGTPMAPQRLKQLVKLSRGAAIQQRERVRQ